MRARGSLFGIISENIFFALSRTLITAEIVPPGTCSRLMNPFYPRQNSARSSPKRRSDSSYHWKVRSFFNGDSIGKNRFWEILNVLSFPKIGHARSEHLPFPVKTLPILSTSSRCTRFPKCIRKKTAPLFTLGPSCRQPICQIALSTR